MKSEPREINTSNRTGIMPITHVVSRFIAFTAQAEKETINPDDIWG
jgi:hypothetical protein